MLDIFILAISFIFVYVNIAFASKCNLPILGMVAGIILILTGFWLFDDVCYNNGISQITLPYNITTEDNVTITGQVTTTTENVCTIIVTPYFNFFTVLQIICFMIGIYFTLEFIYRQYNL